MRHEARWNDRMARVEMHLVATRDIAFEVSGRSFRMAEGAKQSFQFQSWPETAALLKALGADTRLGIPGTVQERLRDVPVGADLPR